MIRILFLYKDYHHPDGINVEGLRSQILLDHGASTAQRLESVGGATKVELEDPTEVIDWYGETEHCKEPDATHAVSVHFGDDSGQSVLSKQLMTLSTVMGEELGRPLNYIITDY